MEIKIHKLIAGRNVRAGKPQHLLNPLRPVLAPVPLSDMENQMETKRCPKCGETKEIVFFSKKKKAKDGLNWWCKDCCNKCRSNWRKQNREWVSTYTKDWSNRHSDKRNSYQDHYRKISQEKIKARRFINLKIINGTIKRQPCEVCGAIKTDAHHDDYSKPLEVRWLCRSHHKQLHCKKQESK